LYIPPKKVKIMKYSCKITQDQWTNDSKEFLYTIQGQDHKCGESVIVQTFNNENNESELMNCNVTVNNKSGDVTIKMNNKPTVDIEVVIV